MKRIVGTNCNLAELNSAKLQCVLNLYCDTVRSLYCNTVFNLYCDTVLNLYCNTVLNLYCNIVLNLYSNTVLNLSPLLGCQGCQGGVVPLTGEHVVLLGVVRPLWSPPDTQLSPVAPRSCLHATAATPRATASTGRQNLVRVADAFITIGDLGLVYLCMWRLDLADCAEETTRLVQRAGRRTQQSVVEREQGTVRHKDTAGHPLHPNLSPVV